ncbi:MAG: hypothetical protein L3J21_03375 [Devosiaceae bacterium]|nr:hypothetical protein [Devosiaceae bacterium]
MRRFSSIVGAALAVASFSANAIGAEKLNGFGPDELRGSYPEEWGFSEEPDPLDFEIGIRYWYSMGSSAVNAFGGFYSASDTSSIAEAFFRIDDNSTSSFLKGQIGYAVKIDGTYITPQVVNETMAGGYIGYGGVDFGMVPFGTENIGIGAFAGYQFIAANPNMGRSNFVTASGGGDSATNALEIHVAKIGLAINADIGDNIDLNMEAAIIPYANLSGVYGALSIPDFISGGDNFTQGSAGNISGRLYGASGEVMLGFKPTENLVVRVGARGWYLTGEATMNVIARQVGTPANAQNYIDNVTGLEFFRYGALAEIAGTF